MTNSDEVLAIGIWQLACRAHGDPYARAVVEEMIRLYLAAGERLPSPLAAAPPPRADYPVERPEFVVGDPPA